MSPPSSFVRSAPHPASAVPAASALPPAGAEQHWQTLDTTGFPGERVNSPLLALNPQGIPYLGYTNNNRQVQVHCHVHGQWHALNRTGLPASASLEALRIGRHGQVFIACMDDGENGAATVLQYTDEQWRTVGKPGFSPSRAYNLRLALDERDIPVLCFSDGDTWNGVVMRYRPEIANWLVSGNIAFGMSVDDPSLVLDIYGLPYVAFIDTHAAAIRVKRLQDGIWRMLNAGLPRLTNPYHPTLAFDREGTLFLSVGDMQTETIRLFRLHGEQWYEIGDPLHDAARPTLAIASCGTPYLAFQDLADPRYRLQVRCLRQQRWELVGTAHASHGYSHSISLALAADNRPYLASKDEMGQGGFLLSTLPAEEARPLAEA